MSWFNFWTENLQKKCCRYLLQRYVGRFLERKIEPDQLSINVLDGAVSLEDIILDVQALNDVGDEHQLPFEFVEGSVDKISLSVPWRNMLKESSVIHIDGLSLTVRPNVKETEGIPSSMLESVWSSMSNSVYSSPDSDYEESFDNAPESEQVLGLEVFTQAIESILNRIKVKFSNTVIKLEYMPDFMKLGLGLQLHIISLDYIDEVADESKEGILYDSLAFLTKKLVIEGVYLQTYEFKSPKFNNEGPILRTNITDPITIAELTGTQAIRMVLKHNPSLPGPKLSLEINFGPLNVICSPRQLYLVIEILRGISKPLTEQKQSAPVQKPMSESDFNRIEQDLFNHIEPKSDADVGLRGMQGWSNLQDDEEEFFPLQGAKNKTFAPSMNSSMTSSMSSMASSKSDLSSRHTRHKSRGKNEWLGETNHFSVHLSSLCVVLLHEDILAVCPETDIITQCSLNEMRKISHQYLMAVQNSDIIKDCDKITKSLERNHLKLVASNVIMDGDEKTNETVKNVNITASGADVLIMEVLIETAEEPTQYIPILKFVQDAKSSPPDMTKTSSDQPDIQIQFKHNTKSTRYCNPVSSEIKITMQDAFSEVDISIINRLSSYIYNPDFKIPKKSSLNVCQPQFSEVIESVSDTNMSCMLNFNYLVIKFRFPVPDLRPLSDLNRLPWWKRILRDDILWLHLSDVEGSFTKTSQQTITSGFEVQCRTIEALFQEGNTNNLIPIAKCKGLDDDLKTIRMDAKRRPKLTLKLCPVVSEFDEIKIDNLNVEHNMTSSVYVESSKKPSPFASKKIMRQRNTHPDFNEREEKLGDGEVQVVPGSREEIMEFVEHTNANAKVYLDINLPCVFVTLPSKHIYETIYNRFTNDLFFWSPSFPTPASRGGDTNRLSHILNKTRYFAPCKSGIQFDSESESEDETSNVYYSCGQSSMNIADPMIKRTEFCLNLNVAHGLFTIVTQSRDRSGRVIPQHYGELQITFEDLYLYMAAGYENTPRHNFICVQANKFSLSHENLSTNSDNLAPKEVICRKNKSLKRVLYKIPDNMDFKERTSLDKSDMLTVVVEISVCNHIKTIRVANEIYGTTLRHIFSVVAQSWYYQLSDFFDVVDYPVAGYESPHVITELHQHITECLIDYRPLHLPYQCVLTIGNFSLSSNIVARSKASTLQIVSEDVAFFISTQLTKAENVDLMANYICVMDLGVFELSLKLSKNSKQSNASLQPEVDLKMGVNVIHIRTCADSAFAFCRILSYLASDGDKSTMEEEVTEFEGVEQVEQEPVLLNQVDSDSNSLSSLIMEAMHEEATVIKKPKESANTARKQSLNNCSTEKASNKGVEIFYFPDETNKIVTSLDDHQPLETEDEDDDIEKEFCFVEHEAGSGLMPQSNIPEVRMLTDSQIRLVNNYFKAPVGKIDMLQAPDDYPAPVVRYTLREMTLIWHIYGGTDFGTTKTTHNELTKHVTIVSETNSCPTSPNTLRPSLSRYYSQSNINAQKNPTSNKGSAKISQARTRFCCSVLPSSWQAKGGAGRQHHILMQLQLNKVRFQHEVYPLHTKHAMRQVILIQELEIRDKLASSNINKFLYLYSSEAMPKQHDANMLVAKVAHTRPDSNLQTQECCVKVSMLPLRLNIDQDSLIFLISFVNQFNSLSLLTKDEILSEKKMPTKTEEPIMTFGSATDNQLDITPNPLIQLNDEFDEHFGQKDTPVITKTNVGATTNDSKAPVYIRQFVFSPDVTIRLDYEGRHIDFSQGSLSGLLMGLAQLNCSEITLKRIVHKHGLLGFDKLLTYVTQEWLQDIKKHQLPSLLGGVGPMYSFVRLVHGIKDLIQLPIEQYQKDGRIVRGLQRGANSFTTSTAMAALEIATRIVNLIQRVAETTYDMVNPGPSMRQLRLQESKKRNRSNKRSHPADIREGVATAVMLVKEGIGETAQTIVRVASEEHEIKGTAGMVGGVMRQIPPTALTPIILASQATCNVLQGVRCQLAPDARVEAMQKWRCD